MATVSGMFVIVTITFSQFRIMDSSTGCSIDFVLLQDLEYLEDHFQGRWICVLMRSSWEMNLRVEKGSKIPVLSIGT